ncbi:solute carrier family 23 member 1-like [Lineus longissimus]|uniref:solute carrier family 23 member 1-like n=1 Tax=Lineus longissimus TaxID=88925 RepID=UPI002B4C88B1
MEPDPTTVDSPDSTGNPPPGVEVEVIEIEMKTKSNAEVDIKIPLANEEQDRNALMYAVGDNPPIHMAFIFGLQQVLLSISSSISIPLIVADTICAGSLELVKAELLGTFLVMCGISTILQCILGVRLPIIQGGCHKFIPAVVALMSLQKWRCPDMGEGFSISNSSELMMNSSFMNGTNSTMDVTEVWQSRMREIQGGIMVASLTQVVIGTTGILGFILRFIGPLTLAPTITLVGLSLFDVGMSFCQVNWGIAILTLALLLLFSLYLGNVPIPVPAFTRKLGCHVMKYPVFKLLPVILAIAISWSVCAILTVCNVFTNDPDDQGYKARVDANIDVLYSTKWLFFPYPGQWGMPTVSAAGYMAMMAATFTSVVESVGDYYACARVCQEGPPPPHAVNRGCAVEGLSSILSGAFGSGGATTSYSQNIGAIGFTKVGSRLAFIMAGFIFIVCGVFGKFGAILTMMPAPILGAIITLSFGMVSAIGLSSLQFIDLGSSRNQCILGFSLIMGLMIPGYFKSNPNAISTGMIELDQVLVVLFNTPMFIGGVLGCFLDNTVPGTEEERGIIKWRQETMKGDGTCSHGMKSLDQVYELPYVTPWLKEQWIATYIPFLPSYSQRWHCSCRKSKKSSE